jgi:hypothetical protein
VVASTIGIGNGVVSLVRQSGNVLQLSDDLLAMNLRNIQANIRKIYLPEVKNGAGTSLPSKQKGARTKKKEN